jgi:hypothetical protein
MTVRIDDVAVDGTRNQLRNRAKWFQFSLIKTSGLIRLDIGALNNQLIHDRLAPPIFKQDRCCIGDITFVLNIKTCDHLAAIQ